MFSRKAFSSSNTSGPLLGFQSLEILFPNLLTSLQQNQELSLMRKRICPCFQCLFLYPLFWKFLKHPVIPNEITTGSLSKNNFNSLPLLIAEIFFPSSLISSMSFSLFVFKNETFSIVLF